MKILNLYILKTKTLEEILKEAKRSVLVLPNKMISVLLRKLHKADEQ